MSSHAVRARIHENLQRTGSGRGHAHQARPRHARHRVLHPGRVPIGRGRRAPANRDMARVCGSSICRTSRRRSGSWPRHSRRRARRRPAGRTRAARKATRASSASVGTAGRTVPRVCTPESRLFAGIDQRSQGRRGASVGLGACPGSAAAARPVAACATIAGRPVLGGLDAIPGAQTGGVRRPAARRSVAASCCRGGRPYAVVRRTRRRGDAVRGAAAPTVWGRRRAGTACACCAR